MAVPKYLRADADGVLLAVKLQPRSSRSGIDGIAGDELRVRVTAAPVDSAANEALVRLLAERFGCAKGRVEIVRGHTSRHKLVRLHGFAAEQVERLVQSAMSL